MNRKLKENREKRGSSSARNKAGRLLSGNKPKFNVAKRPKRWQLMTHLITIAVFIGLIFIGLKSLNSYNAYEAERPVIDITQDKQKDFDLFMAYGQYDLETRYYEGAKKEFEEALKIFPTNKQAKNGLKTANEHLNNYPQFD